MKSWKQEKAKALRKYIIMRLSENGIVVQFPPYEAGFKLVVFSNPALDIRYYKTLIQADKSIEEDIKEILFNVERLKEEIKNAWGENLDTTFMVNGCVVFEELRRLFVADKIRTALHISWLHDPNRLDDVKKYEELMTTSYLDNLYGA